MLQFLVDTIFVDFERKVFQQIVDIPMDTNCALLPADIIVLIHSEILRENSVQLHILIHRWRIVTSHMTEFFSPIKASVHSFNGFTWRFSKLSFTLSMHLLPRMNVLLDFIWTLPVQRRGTRNKFYNKILPTVGFEPTTPHGLQITSPPLSQLAWYDVELNVHEIYFSTIYK